MKGIADVATIPDDVKQELQNMTQTIIGMYPDSQVILFGSYAQGGYRT